MVAYSLTYKVLSIIYKSVMLAEVLIYFSWSLYEEFDINLQENSSSKKS